MPHGVEIQNSEGRTLVDSESLFENFAISDNLNLTSSDMINYWFPSLKSTETGGGTQGHGSADGRRIGTGQSLVSQFNSDHPNALIFARPNWTSSTGSALSSTGLTHNDLGFGFVVSRSLHGAGVGGDEVGVWYGHTAIDHTFPNFLLPSAQGGGRSFDAIFSGGNGSVTDSGGTNRNFTYPTMPEDYLTPSNTTGGFAEVGRQVQKIVVLKLTPTSQDVPAAGTGEYGFDVRGNLPNLQGKVIFSATRSKPPIVLAVGEVPHGKEFIYEVPSHVNSLNNIDYKKIYGFMGNTESYNIRTFASGPYTTNSTAWGTEQFKKVKRVQYTFYYPNAGDGIKNNGSQAKIGIRNMEHYQFADASGKYPDSLNEGGARVEKSEGQPLPFMLIYNPWDALQTGE